jgi:hypothetical protein
MPLWLWLTVQALPRAVVSDYVQPVYAVAGTRKIKHKRSLCF